MDSLSILTKKEKSRLLLLTGGDLLISLMDIVFLIVLLYLIRFYTEPATTALHPLFLISVFLIAFALKNSLGFLLSRQQFHFVYQVASRISKNMLQLYLNSSYSSYVKTNSSVINRSISQQPIEFSHYVLNGFQQIFTQSVLIAITLTAITLYNPLLFPLLLIIMAPPVIFVGIFLKKKLNTGRLLGREAGEKSIQHLQEALNGFIESNTQGKNHFFTERYSRFQNSLNAFLSERVALQNLPARLIEVFAVFGLFLLIVLNYFFYNHHSVQIITLGALMISAYKIIPGLVRIINMASQIKTYAYTTEGLHAARSPATTQQSPAEELRCLEFDHIRFSYANQKILKGFSGKMQKGDMAAVTGLSGKGKTTLVNILLGFLEPDSGDIKFNGKQLSAGDRKKYWRRISYSKQHPFLLHAPLSVNLTFQETGYDKNKVEKVMVSTGLRDRHADSEADILITENGKNFSGGQRQRVTLARALYREFDLLILDEPFSELDKDSENQLLKHLQNLASEGKMILLITHNAEAIGHCSKLFILDEA